MTTNTNGKSSAKIDSGRRRMGIINSVGYGLIITGTIAGAGSLFGYGVASFIVSAAFICAGTVITFWTGVRASQAFERQLAKERGARSQLEAAVQSRRLSQEQRERLVSAVRTLLPFRVLLEVVPDQDAQIYARHIQRALEEGGASVSTVEAGTYPPERGLAIGGSGALKLAKAFMSAKISFAQGASNGELRIVVGLKVPKI